MPTAQAPAANRPMARLAPPRPREPARAARSVPAGPIAPALDVPATSRSRIRLAAAVLVGNVSRVKGREED